MGFHLTNRVYRYVKGLTSTQQAILAYIAFRADDDTEQTDYHFSIEQMADETCFRKTAISEALKALKIRGLLNWRSGGRLKGGKGRAFANHYVLTLPSDGSRSSIRQTDNAVSAKRTMHSSPDGQCIVRQTDTFILLIQ